MARIQKDTANYFPHEANASAGDTLTVLQGRYKNDGYAFWFKLLERLTAADGHYLDLRNTQKWQIFVAKMGVDEQTTVEIMNLLVEMQAIDGELWQLKLVWCQNLVNNLADVYKNRKREVPVKPVPASTKLSLASNGDITTVEKGITTGKKPITTPENTHIKVNKSKLKESKEEEKENTPSLSLSKEDAIELYREKVGELSEDMENELKLACLQFSPAWVIDAINEAVKRGKKDWRYTARILENWRRFGKNTKASKQDPDKYIKGKYGHMVRR